MVIACLRFTAACLCLLHLACANAMSGASFDSATGRLWMPAVRIDSAKIYTDVTVRVTALGSIAVNDPAVGSEIEYTSHDNRILFPSVTVDAATHYRVSLTGATFEIISIGSQATNPASIRSTLAAQISGLTSDGLALRFGQTMFRPVAGATSLTLGSLPSGTSYSVVVVSQPPLLTCGIDRPSGTLDSDTVIFVSCAANPQTIGPDLTHLQIGDSRNILRRSSGQQPEKGKLWLCGIPANGAGARPSSDWLNVDGTWNYDLKPRVSGAVSWEGLFRVEQSGGKRLITGNGLPSHPTGIFPITRHTSPAAAKYDTNPSSIRSQNVSLTFDLIPSASRTPNCVPYGASGILLTGAAVYHGASTLGTDAAAYEMLDEYGGHSDGTGTYHYHFLSPGLLSLLDDGSSGHSRLMGYMMDGFGLYGPRGDDGKIVGNEQLDECHGHTHTVSWDGQDRSIYHYHWTYDFPYNIGCFRGIPAVPWNGR